MNYSTVYVRMDIHKETFSLSCYTNEKEVAEYPQKVEAHHSKVINYLETMRFHYGDDVLFICGYEAGCLGFTLYHELTAHNVKCVILAPTTMPVLAGKKKIRTDKRDAAHIAKCLAHHNYNPVHIPTQKDEQVKEFIQMRDDHKLALKKVKQQILAFCLRHGYQYDGTKNHWTQAHINWLRALKVNGLYQEILEEYLLTYDYLTAKLERLDQRIKELASEDEYKENVHKLECFLGIRTHTALSVITETDDYRRFPDARHYAAYLSLIPGRIPVAKIKTGLVLPKSATVICGCFWWSPLKVSQGGRLGINPSYCLPVRKETHPQSLNMQIKLTGVSGGNITD